MFKQGLYWDNISSKGALRCNLGFLKYHLNNNFFLNNPDPYFFYTGTGKISRLSKIQLTEKNVNYFNKKGLKFYLYEPLTPREKNKNYTNGYYSEFKTNDCKEIEFEELKSISDFVIKNNLKNVTVYTCDYNVKKLENFYANLKLVCYDTFIRHAVSKILQSNNVPNTIQKKFFCTNWRYTPHRHLVMCYLSKLDGNYSWYFNTDFKNTIPDTNWFSFNDLSSETKTILTEGVAQLNDQQFLLDYKISKTKVNSLDFAWPNNSAGLYSGKYYLKCKESFCFIVNETRFAYPFGNFSEKTLMAMHCKIPFIIVAPPQTLKYIKELGFKTFNRWWDESYDQEEDHQKRLIKIFDLIDFINNKSLDELASMYQGMNEVLEHNYTVLKTFSKNNTVLF
jgi:hypothetical protein